MSERQQIWCCVCVSHVNARLTNGLEIYPHRSELHARSYWICDACKNYVGTYFKSNNPSKPLGCIASKELRAARERLHFMIDKLWMFGRMSRHDVYRSLSKTLGRSFHCGDLRSMDEIKLIEKAADTLRASNNFTRSASKT